MSDSANPADKRLEGLNNDALRALNSLNFGPAWASGNAPQPKSAPKGDEESGAGRRDAMGEPARRDRRGFDRPRREFKPGEMSAELREVKASSPESGERPEGERRTENRQPRREFGGERRGDSRPPRRDGAPTGERREFRPRGDRPEGGDRGRRFEGRREGGDRRPEGRDRPAPFRPIVKVDFFPEEKPFAALLKTLKDSCRTVELFEIAKSILEKPERFQVSVKPLDAEKNPEARLYRSTPDSLPFLSEQEAFDHAFAKLAETLFTTETVQVEAPKGVFTTIARCGLTGEFIAPNTYHGYQKALRDHHAAKIRTMPFDRFLSRVETVKDETAIAAWLEKKKSLVRYTLKDRAETEPEHFDSLEALKTHLHTLRKETFVQALPFVRFAGSALETIPAGPLRASVEHELTFQRRFPLDTANAVRGRLRKGGFTLYKRGSKGVTYLCGVKRKFRTASSAPFSDAIARVFDGITRLQDAAASKYPHAADLAESLLGAKPEGDTAGYDSQLGELALNLRYLVTEGYVTEFADGRLFALPVQTEAQAKAAAAEEAAADKTEVAQDETTA